MNTPGSSNERRIGAIARFLLGKIAVPDHPETPLNPNGRRGFEITEIRVGDDRIAVRGRETMWFGESSLLEIKDAPETRAKPFDGLLSWALRPCLPHCELSIRFESVETAQAARETIRGALTWSDLNDGLPEHLLKQGYRSGSISDPDREATPCAMCADGIGREHGYHEVDGEQIECPALKTNPERTPGSGLVEFVPPKPPEPLWDGFKPDDDPHGDLPVETT